MNTKTPPAPRASVAERTELDEAVDLLSRALAEAPDNVVPRSGAARNRLLRRVADSAARHRGMVTVRRRHGRADEPAPGVQVRWLYRTEDARALRVGEPVALALIELAPGTRLDAGLGLAGGCSEWLVLRGAAQIDGVALNTLDHHARAATAAEPVITSEEGATLYVRNGGREAATAGTSRAREAAWEDFAPGIRRRVLWQHGGAIGYLARAAQGAVVPPHGHHRDEECLMLEGDLFLGDILVREGDFQLAPAGVVHGTVQAGSDCVVYIRGDAELAFDLAEPQPA